MKLIKKKSNILTIFKKLAIKKNFVLTIQIKD